MRWKLLLLLMIGMVLFMAASKPASAELRTNSSWIDMDYNVLYMRMDNASIDDSGYGNDGTQQGTKCLTTITGVVNTSCDFEQDDDEHILINYANSLNITENMTFSVWVRAESDTNAHQVVFGRAFAGGVVPYLFEYDGTAGDDKWFFGSFNGGQWNNVIIKEALPTAQWNHYAGTYNQTHFKIYKNGVLMNTSYYGNDLENHNGDLTIGARADDVGGANFFDGRIDELLLWNRTLSDTQITTIYNCQLSNGTNATACNVSAPDTTYPNVTLQFPSNGTTINDNLTDMICYVSDDTDIVNVSLWGNWSGGNWVVNTTNTSGVNNANYTFNISTIQNGTFYWNCEACDSAGNCNTSFRNWTFTINDTTAGLGFSFDIYSYGTEWVSFNWTPIDNTTLGTSTCPLAGGNMTANMIYGEMWYHNHTGTNVNFKVASTWYPMFFTRADLLNGFTFIGDWNSSSNLTAQVSGVYKAHYMLLGSGQNNHIYYSTIQINAAEQDKCGSHKKMAAGGDVVEMTGDCFINLTAGDDVSVAVQDSGDTGMGIYYGGNLNLIKIGT
jgi:hypothetical protein